MKTCVEVLPQVIEFVSALPPEPRRALRKGIRGLEKWRGDIRPLRAELEGYHRLRVGRWRVVVRTEATAEGRVIRCVYAAPRALACEALSQVIATEGPP